MKRVGYIFGKICDPENIKKAILKSSLGKRNQKRVKQVLNNMDFYTNRIRNMLIEKTYVPSPYSIKTIQDGASKKIRTIHKPNYYPDQIIHCLGANKKILHAMKHKIDHYLKEINLKLKDNWQVFKLDSRDIDFLGYRFFRDRTILRKTNALRIRRRCKKIHKKSVLSLKDASAIISYWGWVKHSNSYRFYKNCFASMVNIWEARKVISYGNKKTSLRSI